MHACKGRKPCRKLRPGVCAGGAALQLGSQEELAKVVARVFSGSLGYLGWVVPIGLGLC